MHEGVGYVPIPIMIKYIRRLLHQSGFLRVIPYPQMIQPPFFNISLTNIDSQLTLIEKNTDKLHRLIKKPPLEVFLLSEEVLMFIIG